MKSASKTYIVTLIAASSLFLGACSHYSNDLASLDQSMKSKPQQIAMAPQDIAPAAGSFGTAMLNEYLARDYYELARYENDKAYDYKASKIYTQKAMTASKGQAVQPSQISSYDISPERIEALTTARAHLVNALKTQSSPENQQALAKAQTGFDCWLERAEEADEKIHYADCKAQFEQSMLSLTAPAAGETTAGATTVYQLGFMQTSAVPDEASNKRIDYIAQTLIAPENASMGIALSAPAGEIGAARINSIRQALIAKGVAATRISLADPAAVPTTVPATEPVNAGVSATIIGATTSITTTTTSQFVPVTPTTITESAQPTPAPVSIAPAAGN